MPGSFDALNIGVLGSSVAQRLKDARALKGNGDRLLGVKAEIDVLQKICIGGEHNSGQNSQCGQRELKRENRLHEEVLSRKPLTARKDRYRTESADVQRWIRAGKNAHSQKHDPEEHKKRQVIVVAKGKVPFRPQIAVSRDEDLGQHYGENE